MTNLIGKQLSDYRILKPIGAGGMGEVYLAEHMNLKKCYAVKVLPEQLARDQNFVARFHDEARVMAELEHPCIVRVHHMGQDRGRYYLVMEYIPGPTGEPESLHDRLKSLPERRLSEPEVRDIAIQVAAAVRKCPNGYPKARHGKNK